MSAYPSPAVLDRIVTELFNRHRLPDGTQDIGIHPVPPCGPPAELLIDELYAGVSE